MLDDQDFHIPLTSAELRVQIEEAVMLRYNLESQLAAAHRLANPYEGIAGVVNVPGLEAARREIERLPGVIEQVENRISSLSSTFADRRMEEERTSREERGFWFRRFMLSLQIGNGAAFLATVAGLLQADKEVLPVIAVLVWAPAIYFGLGVSAAGLLPLLMSARYAFAARPILGRAAHLAVLSLTTLSIGLFALGIGSVIVEITQLRSPAIEAAKAKTGGEVGTAPPASQTQVEKAKAPGRDATTPPQAPPESNQQGARGVVSETTRGAPTPPAAPAPAP